MENLSPYYELAREFAMRTNRSLFLTGKAGTGKTTFLRKLRAETPKQMAIVAPTGVAAINAGGTTIHSFFQLPFTPFIPTVEGRKELMEKTKMVGSRRKVIQELEVLVIDEISMVRADVLDAMDTVLRSIRYRHTEPFGGVQVIFIGDMFQLSPVAIDSEWRILSPYYNSPYFFHSQVINQQKPVYIEFDKIFRQTNANFIQVLNEVRNNNLSAKGLELLQSRYNPLFVPNNDDTYITLTTHNYKADKINAEEISKLKTQTQSFKAEIKGEFNEKSYPTEKDLVLKIGAKVMFIKNDTETVRRFYNGKIGIIKGFVDDKIIIQCPDDKEPIELGKMSWENIRYSTNEVTRQIEEDMLGTFTQYPLRLAWAITIHKSQGLTFDKAIIDAGDAFASGQVYVALSRCRSLEGLVLWSKINPQSIANDRVIVEFEKNKQAVNELEVQLDESRHQFRAYTLRQLFDFRTVIGYVSRLTRTVEEVGTSFNTETVSHLNDLMAQTQNIQHVADKFQMQLDSIFNTRQIDEDFLAERLTAASTFFGEKIGFALETITHSPATSDSRENAREYTDQLRAIFAFMALKQHVFKSTKHPFSVEQYFESKNAFTTPEFKVNAYAKTKSTQNTVNLRHPKLYHDLLALRNEICEPRNLPIYVVAGSKTLTELAEYLPHTDKELLLIDGFGPAKVEKYGELFLNIIRKYCNDNKLESNMAEKIESKPAKKTNTAKSTTDKKEKIQSHIESFELYKAGKTIEEIATIRNLVTSTICSHLGKHIATGELHIDTFLPIEKRERALAIMDQAEPGSVYSMLSETLNKEEVSFFLSWVRANKN